MSVAQQLPEIAPFFMQDCPLCARPNRMVINGVYRDEKGSQIYPDIGYSFCNCKNIFYTRFENISTGKTREETDPLAMMRSRFQALAPGQTATIIQPDPFFCEWGSEPYKFLGWNPRANWILWDKEQFEEEMRAIGFEIISSSREFEVKALYPQTFVVVVRKPQSTE